MFRLTTEEWEDMRSHIVTAYQNLKEIEDRFTDVYEAINYLLEKTNSDNVQIQLIRG